MVQCQDIHHTRVSIVEEGRFFESIANHLVELELHGSYFLWCSCRLFWRNHPHRFPVEYCHRKLYFIHSIHMKEFNVRRRNALYSNENICITNARKITALWLVGDACRCTYYVRRHYLLVVVHGINEKKKTGIL